MSHSFLPFDRDRLAAVLPAGRKLGTSIQVFAETDSTNDLARGAGEAGAKEGVIFFAESQRAGRGRRGRTWIAPAGSALLFSLLVRPRAARQFWPRLTLLAARATIESLSAVGVAASWKWPNDVVVGARKIAGILVEATAEFAVVGIGLNVRQRANDFPPELRETAASVEMITGSGIDREAVAAELLRAFEQLYVANWAGSEFGETREFCFDRAAFQPGRAIRIRAGDTWRSGMLLGYTDEAHVRWAEGDHERILADGLLEEA